MSRPSDSTHRMLRAAGLDPDKLGTDAPPLAGRELLAKGIEEGVEPPQELEQGVLLKGRVHSVYAASGAGKTWLVLWLIKRCLERGEKVVFFDAENGKRIVSERLAALGVSTERMDELLHYYPFPNLTLDPDHVDSYKALLDEVDPALVIFDSLVNFLGSAGLEENSNDDIVKWATRYTRPAREMGVTVVVLDHVPHEGPHARGASRKKDEVDVMWALKAPQTFDRDTVGRIVLSREKDREGWLGERVGFSVGGTVNGFVFRHSEGTIEEPDATDGLTNSARKALDILRADFREAGATAEQWRKATGQATSTFYRSHSALLEGGLVEKRGNRYFPTPTRGDGSSRSEENPTDKPDKGVLPLLPKHSHGSNGSEAGVTPITPTPLKGGSNGSTAGGGGDFASPTAGDTPRKGTEDKSGSASAPRPAKPTLAAGGSAPGVAGGGNAVAGPGVPAGATRGGWYEQKRGRAPASVEELLADPPPWLARQLELCRDNPRLLNPTANSVASAVYGGPHRWQEVLPLVAEAANRANPGNNRNERVE